MSDAFQRGLERAFARKKNNVASAKPKVTQAKPVVKAVTGFDEELYRTTIISKMIKLIHKIQGVKQ
ncbi:hypothetical protein PPUJ20028_49970 [Pseudomonas putida]|uniref:Uncharacterized protein n=1 Tax=Pseudomonas putida TaxID=303 RepID=A0AA37R974_PSEPU|nr:hypothetical protein [Pseudomonas putida]GLO16411.1 hypothetical protein PPUJ20028_49970 [Pseudomonas putida]GLO38217.1 hypothetical protein PPUN14671_50540 [Pseudomonas putida]HDS0966894.1 hypothetical protein [Pseudomonas putida]HDS0993345.1 hypothetical protein [Pseudomonas putida]